MEFGPSSTPWFVVTKLLLALKEDKKELKDPSSNSALIVFWNQTSFNTKKNSTERKRPKSNLVLKVALKEPWMHKQM
jgi:hypothetical protein